MSNNGIKTTFWGPHAWAFLFSSIAGSFPVTVDINNPAHVRTIKSFQTMFNSLQYTLPCIYCRESYGKFIKLLPMKDYLHSRRSMMKWLYLLHDKVNVKLIAQERECYEKERDKLLKKNLSSDKLKQQLKDLRSNTFRTKPSPPFERVLAMYEKQRAGCSKKAKRCL